jgi:hypothetical protein
VDPLADKYPSLSAYNYCGLNPIKYIDPNGDSLKVSGNTEAAMNDLRSIVKPENQSYINSTDGSNIYIDASNLTTSDFENDEGLKLLNSMINSTNNYLYEVSETNNNTPLASANSTIENNSKEPRMEFNKVGNNLPDGFQGQVIIHPNALFIATNGETENRSSVVFHELAENFERTDHGLKYMYINPNDISKEDPNRPGAHQTAINRAKNLAPTARSVSGSEGRLRNAIIK